MSSNQSPLSSSTNLYTKILNQYLPTPQPKLQNNNNTIQPKYSVSSLMISQKEAQEVTNNKREYHLKSTFTHSRHPDLLKFKQTAHGNKFILCRDEKRSSSGGGGGGGGGGSGKVDDNSKGIQEEQMIKKSQKSASDEITYKSKTTLLDEQQDQALIAATKQRGLSVRDNIGLRYFDKRVNPQIKCFHCKQVGHEAKSCPNQYQSNIICSSCGSNQHVSQECPIKLICFKCGKPGHKITECLERGVKMCKRCGKGGHNERICLLFMNEEQGSGEVKKARRSNGGQRPAVNENDLLLCQIDQSEQEYLVSEQSVNNCLHSVKQGRDDEVDQIEDNPNNIEKLAKLLEKDELDFDLDFNITLGMGT